MIRAKEIFGKEICLAGNVPLSLLCTGTVEGVESYCKDLIDMAGKGGGFILSTGAGLDRAKPENIQAMIEFSKNYSSLDKI